MRDKFVCVAQKRHLCDAKIFVSHPCVANLFVPRKTVLYETQIVFLVTGMVQKTSLPSAMFISLEKT